MGQENRGILEQLPVLCPCKWLGWHAVQLQGEEEMSALASLPSGIVIIQQPLFSSVP